MNHRRFRNVCSFWPPLPWFSKWMFPQQSGACVPFLPNPGRMPLTNGPGNDGISRCVHVVSHLTWLALSVAGVNISQSTLFSETCSFFAFLSNIQAANLLLLYSVSAYKLAYGRQSGTSLMCVCFLLLVSLI